MTKRTATVQDGRYDSERMRELGRRGAAAVGRGAGGKFAPKAAASPAPELPEPPAPAPDPTPAPSPAPEPRIEDAPGLLGRFLGRGR